MITDKLDTQFEDSLFSRLEQQRKIWYFMYNDPRFLFEYKKTLLQEITKKTSQSQKQERIKDLVSEAEKRRIQFMVDSLEQKSSLKKSTEELLNKYKKISAKYSKELNQLIKKAKKIEASELDINPDYKNMKENFDKMNKKTTK